MSIKNSSRLTTYKTNSEVSSSDIILTNYWDQEEYPSKKVIIQIEEKLVIVSLSDLIRAVRLCKESFD